MEGWKVILRKENKITIDENRVEDKRVEKSDFFEGIVDNSRLMNNVIQ